MERNDAEQHSPVRDRSFWGRIINQPQSKWLLS